MSNLKTSQLARREDRVSSVRLKIPVDGNVVRLSSLNSVLAHTTKAIWFDGNPRICSGNIVGKELGGRFSSSRVRLNGKYSISCCYTAQEYAW